VELRRRDRRCVAALGRIALAGCGGHAAPPKPKPAATPAGGHAAPPVAPSLAKAAEAHLRALARIGAEHGQTRAAGTAGYAASVAYVAGRLRAAGYRVRLQPVPFPVFRERRPPQLEANGERVPVATLSYSAPGRVRAPLVRAGRGCRRGDFARARRRIALVERGRCIFRVKARLAQAAGARALVVADPASLLPVPGSLIRPGLLIPAVAAGSAALALRGTARITVDTLAANRTTHNVIAGRAGPPARRVAMLGAHLDSVREGPGINDNGSGVASTLALAERLRGRRGLRFGFWAAEELGLYGSRRYVASLSAAERRRIAGYINLDMVGSPNPVRYVYGHGPARAALERALRARRLRFQGISIDGSSDHAPFERAGISVGGLYSGSDERKTAAQATAYGGRAGRSLDSCYHQRCDMLARVDRQVLAELADAAGRALVAIH
jgi:hypothetical protein